MPIWSFNTDAAGGLSLEEALAFGAEQHFASLEVSGDRPFGFFEEVDADTRARCRAIAEDAGVHVTYHSPINGSNLGSSVEAIRDESVRWMRGGLDMAADLGATLFVVHPPMVDYEDDALRGACFTDSVRHLRTVCDLAAERGMRVGLENIGFMDETLDRSMEELVELYGTIDHPNLTYVLDFGHALLTGGYAEIDKGIRLMGRDLSHIHLTDNHGRLDDHIEIGMGVIDYTRYADFLRAFAHPVVLELVYEESDGAEILRSRDTMDGLLGTESGTP